MNQVTNYELKIFSTIEPLVNVMQEVIDETNFLVEPSRWSSETSQYKQFQIYLAKEDKKSACGSMEFIESKAGTTMVKLNTPSSSYPSDRPDITHINRLFYLFVQRLLQLGIVTVDE